MDTLVFDVGLAHKLKKAFAREGWTAQEIDALCEGDKLHHALAVLRGHATIVPKNRMIDANALPSGIVATGQRGWSLVEHVVTGPRNTGFLDWNPENVALHPMQRLSVSQFLAQPVSNQRHLNASVLTHLVIHDYLVPHSWRGMNVLFLGTRFRSPEGEEVVRCLFYSPTSHQWTWKHVSVTRQLGDDYIVAMLKI